MADTDPALPMPAGAPSAAHSPTPEPAAPAARQGPHPGRRGFIRLGSATVPTALTLSARPVMAWHCNSPSASASAAISANASGQTRASQTAVADECWSISQWQANTSRAGLGAPWSRLQTVTGWNPTKCTVAMVFSGATMPFGLSAKASQPAQATLKALSSGSFEAAIMTARLNYLCLDSVRACLKSNGTDDLSRMATGSYTPANSPGVTWGAQDIINYLHNNWLARQ